MQLEGPFSRDQLVLEAEEIEGSDPFNEDELHEAWSKMATSEKACSAPSIQPVAMTPLSKSSSDGTLSRLEEVWDSTLDTPFAKFGNTIAAVAESPLVRKVDSTRPVPPSRLHECIAEGFASSPGSRQDLFSKQDSGSDAEATTPGCFGGFTGAIADSLLAGVATPSQLRNDPIDEEEAEDIVMDDMLDDLEIEAGDLDFGLTQGVLGREIPLAEMSPAIPHVGFTTAKGARIASPSKENLAKAQQLFDVDSPKTVYPTTSDFDLLRRRSLFRDVELNVSTPMTPCLDVGDAAPDTLITGMSSYVETPGYFKENIKDAENVPTLVGFASAAGKKLSAPSAASLRKAEAMFRNIEKEVVTEKQDTYKEEEENEVELNQVPQVPYSVGFSSASGKKIDSPSEGDLKKARAMFDRIEREFQAEHQTLEEHLLLPKSPRVSFTVGFSSASGKNNIAPSEKALKKARVMFEGIEQEFQVKPVAPAAGIKPTLKERKSTSTLDLNRFAKKIEPAKAALKFSNLKAVASKTLGNSRRSSTSIGKASIRSSISPSREKRDFSMTPREEEKVKSDPLKYFDLTIPENRVRLKELSLNRPVTDEAYHDIDKDRIFTMFMSKGPNPNCAEKKWVWNHIDLIWWKVTSTVAHFPDRNFYRDMTLEKIIVEQLLYRYEREINVTQMSILKKISEGNESPLGLFVFLIKDINTGRNELLLSDGWYSLWAVADKEIMKLIDERRLKIGMKIEVTNIGLLKKEETAILDAEESGFKLIVAFNSIRPCRWHEKLGRKRAFTFRRPLKYARRDGGVISCVEAVVTRRYPDIIVVQWEDDKHTEKSKHEWEKMVNSNFDEGQNRPCSISKTIRLQIVDPFCGTKASVKLLKASEELAEKLVEGRIIRLLECKPLTDHNSSLELRVYKTLQQCFLLGMSLEHLPMKLDTTRLYDLVAGHEYDVTLRIVRSIPGEHHLWGINSDGVLISIDLGRFAPTLPKFISRELVTFLNLEYRVEDKKLGIEVFSLSIVSDWDRKCSRTLKIDLDDSVFEKASHYIDGVVTGRFNYA